MTDITLGEEPLTTFAQAVDRIQALAHARLPAALHGNLERATALVKNRHVWMDADGKHAQVLSSDGETWYFCNGHCTCMGATHAPEGWCKHRLSVALYRRAAELLATSACGARPAAAAALPEAPASVNVRLCIGGAEVQWTLRDLDEHRLAARLAALLARFPQAPAAPAPATPAGQPTPEGWCLIHNTEMKLNQNARGKWFSHKSPDGSWCRGKAPRV